MAFGQQSGPPATARQVRDLLALLQAAGHADFRDARGPLGFTQRQAAGKFTRDEATSFIEQLETAESDANETPLPVAPQRQPVAPQPFPMDRERPPASGDATLRRVPVEQLAIELERRGWIVIPPP